MKKSKKIESFLMFLGVAAAFSLPLNAQFEEASPGSPPGLPTEGYVILSSGDTIPGKLRWTLKYVENNPVEIKFKTMAGVSETYNASQISGFGFMKKVWMENNPEPILMGYEHYVSLPSIKEGVPVFMNRLMKGRVTIFQNRSAISMSSRGVEEMHKIDGIGFSFTPGEGLSIGPTYRVEYKIIEGRTRCTSYFVIKDNGAMLKVEKENYEELFNSFFGDCPALEEELERNPDLLKFRNFMIVAEVYNQLCR